jgi:hypothetical protein
MKSDKVDANIRPWNKAGTLCNILRKGMITLYTFQVIPLRELEFY